MKSNLTIKATPNYSKRTFTIKVIFCEIQRKYRTVEIPIDEFDEMKCNSEFDWWLFLKRNTKDYFRI